MDVEDGVNMRQLQCSWRLFVAYIPAHGPPAAGVSAKNSRMSTVNGGRLGTNNPERE